MRKKLLLVLILGSLLPAAFASEASPLVEKCRAARADAWEALRLDCFSKTPTGFELESFLRVAEQCSAASEKATNSRDAAYLAAESALCRAIYERRDGIRAKGRQPEEEMRLYQEGIDIVTALDGEHSPALLELLDELAVRQWDEQPREAVRLVERRVEIARSEYGETDPRYVEVLMRAGRLFQPFYNGGEREVQGADDPKAAERYYRAALKALGQGGHEENAEIYGEILGSLQYFYMNEGREKEAEEVDRLVREVYLEIQVEEELSRLREQEAEAVEEEAEPPGEEKKAEEGSPISEPPAPRGSAGSGETVAETNGADDPMSVLEPLTY